MLASRCEKHLRYPPDACLSTMISKYSSTTLTKLTTIPLVSIITKTFVHHNARSSIIAVAFLFTSLAIETFRANCKKGKSICEMYVIILSSRKYLRFYLFKAMISDTELRLSFSPEKIKYSFPSIIDFL